MKRKLTIVLATILTFSLILAGCTVAAAPAASEDNDSATNDNAAASTLYDDGYRTGAGYANRSVSPVEVGTGYRGGNGNGNGSGSGNAGQGYLDSCDPVYNDSTTPDPDFALSEADRTLSLVGYGSSGALDDTNLTLADMLTYAIQDEYLAYAEYDRILSENGSVRPFTNILRAEESHIDALLPLFDAYGVAAPADEGASRAVSAGSLTDAYQAGVSAEVNNIAMYETFLDQELPSNVRTVFESLMRASENHLRAFQNQL
ncbi:MAG: DUF2202 domain-containing protein [Eubacteriales bacterium]|nr:DUF2202 domain-containing protein [Eubacteriales bacterium]